MCIKTQASLVSQKAIANRYRNIGEKYNKVDMCIASRKNSDTLFLQCWFSWKSIIDNGVKGKLDKLLDKDLVVHVYH